MQNKLSIHEALKEQDPSEKHRKVVELIKNGANVNESNKYFETPLHVAVSKGFEDIVEVLVKSKAELDLRCPLGLTPLHLAIQNNQMNIAQILLDHGASVEKQSHVGQNWLQSEAVRENVHRITPLQFALHLKNYKMIDLLLEHGANISDVEASKLKRLTNLQWAIDQDFKGIALIYLKRFFDFSLDLVELLKSAKSHQMELTLLKGFGFQDPLAASISYKMNHLVKYLIKSDAKYIKYVSGFLMTYLHQAVLENTYEIVKILIQHGFDVNAKTYKGITPLHFAAHRGFAKTTRILIENGAEIDSQTNKKATPLMAALRKERVEVVNMLYKSGASFEIRDLQNLCPLELSLSMNKKHAFKVIILNMHM